ncbi:MAG: Maf family protein [Alphaproteobacteria bacterium]
MSGGQPLIGQPLSGQTLSGQTLILASTSASRARLLADAGVAVDIVPSRVDEDEVKQSLLAEGATPRDVAGTLAELKAVRVSAQAPGALVIGADQVLALGESMLDKPASMVEARGHLQRLRGASHRLVSAVVVALDGRRIWAAQDEAELAMRWLSDAFIDDYLARVGDRALQSVGAYQLEGLGAQLFSRIRGDYFTILGLPLLPLLGFLRDRGVLME